jgi:hypothetical protein
MALLSAWGFKGRSRKTQQAINNIYHKEKVENTEEVADETFSNRKGNIEDY